MAIPATTVSTAPSNGPVRPIEGIAQVLDGDTIQIRTQRIRLLGIDAFEAEAAGFRRARAGGLMALR
jgi:endonuclease YncB( thermonuclease family)